jgi:hypothetical protein
VLVAPDALLLSHPLLSTCLPTPFQAALYAGETP